MEKQDIFTDEFLEEIGFKRVFHEHSPPPIYGRADSIKTSGIVGFSWNTKGPHCTYWGEPLEPSTHLTIYRDWRTRSVFNGYVFTQDDVRKLLTLIM